MELLVLVRVLVSVKVDVPSGLLRSDIISVLSRALNRCAIFGSSRKYPGIHTPHLSRACHYL